MEYGTSPFIPPRLTLRVAITGHRPNRLQDADPALLYQRTREVLASLAMLTERLQDANDLKAPEAPYASGVRPALRFTTALAAGADTIAATAAADLGFALNLILPFPRETYILKQHWTPEQVAAFDRLWQHDPDSTARLELVPGAADPDEGAYRAAGQLMLAHCDILLAIWDGGPAAGIGGTAEVVGEALRAGIPVVRIAPDGTRFLSAPFALDIELPETWLPLAPGTDPAAMDLALETRVAPLLRFPEDDPGHGEDPGHAPVVSALRRLHGFQKERTRTGSRACGFNLLKWIFAGGAWYWCWVDYTAPAEAATRQWSGIRHAAAEIGGPQLADEIGRSLQARCLAADNLALHYSSLYRTAFISNYGLAALAVILGLLIVPAAIAVNAHSLMLTKAILVLFELLCIGVVLGTTRRAKRRRWHERWLDYRSLAEALRPVRLALLTGGSPVRHGEVSATTPGEAWVAWYARSALREIPPPTARIGRDQLVKVIDTAIRYEIDPQIAYHRANAETSERLNEGMERVAIRLLFMTLVFGGAFLVSWLFYLFDHNAAPPKAPAGVGHDVAEHWAKLCVKPVVTYFGGVLPICGAALFGIRATGDFRMAEKQSRRMVRELVGLRKSLIRQRDSVQRAVLRRTLSDLSRTLADDVRLWSVLYSERAVEPGF